MTKIAENLSDLIGNTPLLHLNRYAKEKKLEAQIYAKLEYLNVTGSVKDRIALSMINEAEKSGKLSYGSVIIEPTSGNTGIGLASIAAARGYRIILVMPETMSVERRKLLAAYGAELVLTEGPKGMSGAIEKAKELSMEISGSFIPSQFENPANPLIHRETTGPEIWEALSGKIDIFVCGIGTGGTITGAGTYLKERNSSLKIIAVEPFDSPMLSQGKSGPHKIQGIGAGFVPEVLDRSIFDEIITVKSDDAMETSRVLAKKEGLLAGISSGAALWAAGEAALKSMNKGKNIVVILPDTGERYLSTPLYTTE